MYNAASPLEKNSSALANIIDERAISPVFQAIVDVSQNTIVGYESLARCEDNPHFLYPDQLFAAAEEESLTVELEQLCAERAIECFVDQNLNDRLFINLSPELFFNLVNVDDPFTRKIFDAALHIDLVLELSEKHQINDYKLARELSDLLKDHNISIAIDDLGAGHSGLRSWAEIRPEIVKIDKHFIDNAHEDSIKREFIKSIQEIARGLQCKVIAEGVECEHELQVLRALGIKYFQGYLTHKPQKRPCHKDILSTLPDINISQSVSGLFTRHAHTVASILKYLEPIKPTDNAYEVCGLFKDSATLEALPVVEHGKTVGVVYREMILERFAGRFAYELFSKRQISNFMETEFIYCDKEDHLESISDKITASSSRYNSVFIIEHQSKYAGIGNAIDLLKKITAYQLSLARHSNPLTLLPGNIKIAEAIDDMLESNAEFYVAYFDLNHFKSFNDHYGFNKGDELLKTLADLISNNICPGLDFVGHVGGDDFIVLFQSDDWHAKCANVITQFKERRTMLYSKAAIEQNGFYGTNREGKKQFFELTTVAIGAFKVSHNSKLTQLEIANHAAIAKKQAKCNLGEDVFVIDPPYCGDIT